MIGYVGTGGSFLGCIQYCLNDKKELSEKQKADLSQKDGLKHHGRAEILSYNRCFGNPKELAQQFKDVAKLSKRVEKPVFHFSLRLAPGEALNRNQLEEIGHECAKEFRVANNQYICVLHKDTTEQHIHIVANRVGLDGKAASDSNSYKRMAALCRKLEKQYKLQEVLSPRAFLLPRDRILPRQDLRKEKLKTNIRQTIEKVRCYSEFEKKMQVLGYRIIKGRGISFMDERKVKIKGSEVGFSLAKIEQILSIKQKLEILKVEQKKYETSVRQVQAKQQSFTPVKRLIQQTKEAAQMGRSPFIPAINELSSLFELLLQPEYTSNYLPYELTEEGIKRRRRKEHVRRMRH